MEGERETESGRKGKWKVRRGGKWKERNVEDEGGVEGRKRKMEEVEKKKEKENRET